MKQYYRHPWTEEKVETLKKFWPHWGTKTLASMLNLTNKQIKSKVNKLCIKILPKKQRLCYKCKKNYQSFRCYGILCRSCSLEHRKAYKIGYQKPRKVWMGDILRTIRYRSKEPCNIDLEYLMNLWDKQEGRCFYSNIILKEPIFGGRGRNFDIASIDRINSQKGYVKGNIVWSSWVCNGGKSDLPIEKYIEICMLVKNNEKNIYDNLSKYSFIMSP